MIKTEFCKNCGGVINTENQKGIFFDPVMGEISICDRCYPYEVGII